MLHSHTHNNNNNSHKTQRAQRTHLSQKLLPLGFAPVLVCKELNPKDNRKCFLCDRQPLGPPMLPDHLKVDRGAEAQVTQMNISVPQSAKTQIHCLYQQQHHQQEEHRKTQHSLYLYQDRAARLSASSSGRYGVGPLQSVSHKPAGSLHCAAAPSAGIWSWITYENKQRYKSIHIMSHLAADMSTVGNR